MKKLKLIFLAFLGSVFFFNSVSAQFSGKGDYVALYRLYNSENGDHLYTTDCNEKDRAMRDAGYVYEGVAGYIATRQTRRTTPLYRMLLSSGEHFYTTDKSEVNQLLRDGGNRTENIAGYVAESGSRDTQPFYRLMTGDKHLYTTDEREKNNLMRDSRSRLEQTEGYLWTSGRNACDSGYSNASNDYPVIYSRTDFTGASQPLETDWNVNNDWDGSPNMIRAIRVPRGWYLTLYTRPNFRGKSFTISNDAVFTNDNEWYNRIQSIKVSRPNTFR